MLYEVITGGDRSHEFQVIADTGEDAIVYCPESDYAANIELAEAVSLLASRAAPAKALVDFPLLSFDKENNRWYSSHHRNNFV